MKEGVRLSQDSAALLAALGLGVNDDGGVSATIDSLRENDGFTMLQACIKIAQTHQAAEDAKEVAEASKYLALDAPERERTLNNIVRHAGLTEPFARQVYLMPGNGEPTAHRLRDQYGEPVDVVWNVYVGAAWLLQEERRYAEVKSATVALMFASRDGK